MPNSVHLQRHGPLWPLGSIVVPVPGTPVRLTILVDAAAANAPETAAGPGPSTSDEYSQARCQQIIIQGFKNNAGAGLVANTGNIYIVMKGAGTGTGNRADTGAIVLVVPAGTTGVIGSPPGDFNMFSAYSYFVDADNANDAAQVTLVIGH